MVTNSEFIAGLMGPLFIAMAAAFLIDKSAYRRMLTEVRGSTVTIFMAGVILFVASLAIVRTHNIWEGWPMLITILGWLGVLGGAARMIFAAQAADVAEPFADSPKSMAIISALLAVVGGYLTLKGYQLI